MNRPADTAVMIVCGVALVAAMTVAQAQPLPDPTRPPAFVDKPAAAETGTAGDAAAPAGLQSVIQRRGAPSGAIINGEYVELGGKVGEASLIGIREDAVTLKGAAGKETLELTPGIRKTPVAKPVEDAGGKKPAKSKAGNKGKK